MTSDLNDWLRGEYIRRRKVNPNFSLRAFARLLQMSPGRLSEIFAKKRGVTPRTFANIADRLGLDPVQRRSLGRLAGRQNASFMEQADAASPYHRVSVDQWHSLADWYHFAILSLLETSDFQPGYMWISQRLGISSAEVRDAMERLKRLGLIKEDARRGWVLVHECTATGYDQIHSEALRQSHRDTIKQALHAVDAVPMPLRDISSITMAINPNRIGEAKVAIQKFRRDLAALIETGERTEVYNLNIQLVPVSKRSLQQ